jgi:small GTP-binding protein
MSKIAENPQMLLKIVFVGDSGVGKTSLLRREAESVFTGEFLATIGVDFRIKTYQVGKIAVKAQLWDTAGQERFRSIQKPYYKSNFYLMKIPVLFVCASALMIGQVSSIFLGGWMR